MDVRDTQPPEEDAALRRRRRAAELLAKAELFSGLDRITLAKLAANLDPVSFAANEAACTQGEPGDSLYIVSEGTFGVYVGGQDGRAPVRVNTLSRGGCFGEMALLTGEPRSASVLSDGSGELFRLDHERFTELLHDDPSIGLALSASLSRRLRVTSQNMKDAEHIVRAHVEKELTRLPADMREKVLRASILERSDGASLRALFGFDAAIVGAALASLDWQEGAAPASILAALREAHLREDGAEGVRAASLRAIEPLAQTSCWEAALLLAERAASRADFLVTLKRALRAQTPLADPGPWLDKLSPEELAAEPMLAAARAALRSHQPADALLPHSAAARLQREWERLKKRPTRLAAIGTSLFLVLAAAIASSSSKPAAFLLLLGAAIALWLVAIFPEFVVYLALVVGWVVLGIAKPAEAVAGFGSTAWISIFAVLAIGAALAQSGLVYRLGLLLVRKLPSGLAAQGAAYLFSGLLLTLLVPSSAARARLLLPIALAAAQSQRFKDRSPESAFLGLAAFIGVGPLLYAFLNGSSSNFLGLGLIPEASRARFDLAFWFIAALPLTLFVAIGSLAASWLVLRPRATRQTMRSQVDLQLSLLGRTTGHEVVMALILFALVVGWNVGPAYGLNSAIVGLASVVAAALAGCLNRQSLQDLNWDFLISFGVIVSLPPIMSSLGIDAELTRAVRALMGDAKLSPLILILAVAVINIAIRFLLPRGQTMLLLAIILVPVAPVFGVHPWVVVITVLATFTLWVMPSQSISYVVAYEAAEERLFSHAQARKVCFAFIVVTLLGLAFSLPYWRWLGLA